MTTPFGWYIAPGPVQAAPGRGVWKAGFSSLTKLTQACLSQKGSRTASPYVNETKVSANSQKIAFEAAVMCPIDQQAPSVGGSVLTMFSQVERDSEPIEMSLRVKRSNPRSVRCKPIKLTTSAPIAP